MSIHIIGNEILFPRDSAGAAIAMDYLALLRKMYMGEIKITSIKRNYRREFLDSSYIGATEDIKANNIILNKKTISPRDEILALRNIDKNDTVLDINLRNILIPFFKRGRFIKILYHKVDNRYLRMVSLIYDHVITTYQSNYSNKKVIYIPPPLNTDFFKPIRPKTDEPTILYVGPLFYPRFPMTSIVKALIILNKKIDYKALFIVTLRHHSDEVWIKLFKILIEKYNLHNNVNVTSKVLSEEEKVKIYNKATVLLYTVKPIQMAYPPISVLEAMSCGTPVIMSTEIGFQDLASKRMLIDINSPRELAYSIIYTLENIREFSKKSRRIIEKKYSYKAVMKYLSYIIKND